MSNQTSAELFAGVSSLDELVAKVANIRASQFPERIWYAAALARTIDSGLYQRLADSEPSAPPFAEFIKNPEIALVGQDTCRLRDAPRESILDRLNADSSTLRAISKQILEFALEHEDPLEQFAQRIIIDPSAAEREFERLYREADGRFDLSQCDALLDILRMRLLLLTPTLRDKLSAREDYLASRLLFVDEFYRTASYLEHGDLFSGFRSFVTSSLLQRLRQTKWLLNVHGKGGAGKTMFLRWIISRHCIPEQSPMRTPVARLDLDFVHRALLTRQPWLSLLSVAAQLRSQLPKAPFANLTGPEETSLRNLLHNRTPAVAAEDERFLIETGVLSQATLEDKFCGGLGEERAVVIFDTIEELSLHRPAVLGNLLAMVDRVHRRCPQLRVVLSGRYPVFDPKRALPGLSDELRAQLTNDCSVLPVTPLDPKESERFLTGMRRLGSDQPTSEIVKAAKGNPFALALFADLAGTRTLSAEEVRTANVAFVYLIERIIDRIPDEDEGDNDSEEDLRRKRTQRGLRWLLRYAVVARRILTKEFAASVLSDFLFDEILGRTQRDDVTNLKMAGAQYDNTERRWKHLGAGVDFNELWSALQSYASSSSWVTGSGDELQLQSEIVVPMRQLLTQNTEKYPIWVDLNRAAAEYFERLAHTQGPVGKLLGEALYHRYQAEGQAARRWWHAYLEECRNSDGDYLGAVQELAESFFSGDYLDEERRPGRHFTDVPLIDEHTLGEAALESFLGLLFQQMRRPGKLQPTLRATMSERCGDFVRFHGEQSDARVRLALFAAAVRNVPGLPPALTSETVQPQELTSPDEQIAVALLRAENAALPAAARRDWYLEAIAIAERALRSNCIFQPYFIGSLLAGLDAAEGQLEPAFDRLRDSLAAAIRANASPLDVSELMLKVGDLGTALGRLGELEMLAREVARRPFPAREEGTGWLIRLALDRFDYAGAEALVRAFATDIEPARLEYLADVAAATYRFAEAEKSYAAARSGYQNLQYAGAAAQVLLKHARYQLDILGSPRQSLKLLDPLAGSQLFPEPLIELELDLLRIRQFARCGEPARARDYLSRALALLEKEPTLPRTYAMIATATLIADGVAEAADAERFSAMVSAAPPSARVAALRPFLFGSPEAAIERRMVLPDPTPEMLVQERLAIAAALIFFGQGARAVEILNAVRDDCADLADVLVLVFRLARRIAPDALAPPADWLESWSERARQLPEYAGVVLLEEAERLTAAGSSARARSFLQAASQYLSGLPPDSRWADLLSRLTAELEQDPSPLADLKRDLLRLPPELLLRPVPTLAIKVDAASGKLELRWCDRQPDEHADSRLEQHRSFTQAVGIAAEANDVYPKEFAYVLNSFSSAAGGFFDRLWEWLTGGSLEPAGAARLRRDINGIWPRRPPTSSSALGYAWYRGWLSPVRRRFERNWQRTLSPTPQFPEIALDPTSRKDDVAVNAFGPALAAVPWELGHRTGGQFYRALRGVPVPDTVRFFRRGTEAVRVENEGKQAAGWADFVATLGGREQFRDTLLQRVPLRGEKRVLILQSDMESQRRHGRGYGASGVRVEERYWKHKLHTAVHPIDRPWPRAFQSREWAKDGVRTSVVHVTAQIGESFTPREVFLIEPSGEPIRAEAFAQIAPRQDDDSLLPFIILDIADDPFDRGRTLLCRNVFAARLFVDASRGVLAIGPYPPELLADAVDLLASLLKREHCSLGDLHNMFWKGMVHPFPPALFTLDPDLPVWD